MKSVKNLDFTKQKQALDAAIAQQLLHQHPESPTQPSSPKSTTKTTKKKSKTSEKKGSRTKLPIVPIIENIKEEEEGNITFDTQMATTEEVPSSPSSSDSIVSTTTDTEELVISPLISKLDRLKHMVIIQYQII